MGKIFEKDRDIPKQIEEYDIFSLGARFGNPIGYFFFHLLRPRGKLKENFSMGSLNCRSYMKREKRIVSGSHIPIYITFLSHG